MIQPIDFQSDNIVGLRMTDKITEADIKPWATLLDQKSHATDKLRVYIEYEDVDAITLKAALQDLKFDVTHLGDFEKAALVSDKSWTNLPAFVANMLPNLDAKQFSPSEKEKARQWITS
ncbi:STAS/SEC14 domain-containing protein [Spirosoma sp. SC4-14]|uniref:STAS/SEC14 domain-containing protein n=1 Tax=Spirosoma sp. SC4-14 TaxID=3128900 RepID=UPI0030D1EDA1